MNEIINKIIDVGSKIDNNRTLQDVMIKLTEETGEIAQVISMITGHTTYKSDKEELSGEIADLIIAAIDLGAIYYGSNFEKLLNDKINIKLNKWKEKYGRIQD